MPPENKKPVRFSMERGKRIQDLKAKGYTFRHIAETEKISVTRAFNILGEFNIRTKMIAEGRWCYGLTTRAINLLDSKGVNSVEGIRELLSKYEKSSPYAIPGMGKKIYAELVAFLESKA